MRQSRLAAMELPGAVARRHCLRNEGGEDGRVGCGVDNGRREEATSRESS
jgi:hypothetical protein